MEKRPKFNNIFSIGRNNSIGWKMNIICAASPLTKGKQEKEKDLCSIIFM